MSAYENRRSLRIDLQYGDLYIIIVSERVR